MPPASQILRKKTNRYESSANKKGLKTYPESSMIAGAPETIRTYGLGQHPKFISRSISETDHHTGLEADQRIDASMRVHGICGPADYCRSRIAVVHVCPFEPVSRLPKGEQAVQI
ncbi:hypothetical protein Desti_0258 [Desulfomonile tiedjei DSM 6799]|uniref:Uncharacterized protein n=1 Tax=Desulfomonile tiedjei (strain ATCC 49306 / DSM 6799 / DCB-1) TaxID=706587 RepID=I4C0B2_DESTA|nr:hypothetical protein Desti_0258 [Desulfomonile tiedjei DSM 6799]